VAAAYHQRQHGGARIIARGGAARAWGKSSLKQRAARAGAR